SIQNFKPYTGSALFDESQSCCCAFTDVDDVSTRFGHSIIDCDDYTAIVFQIGDFDPAAEFNFMMRRSEFILIKNFTACCSFSMIEIAVMNGITRSCQCRG